MRAKTILIATLCGLASMPALAQQNQAGIAQRLTAAQIADIGLTPRQMELLDRYLGEADAAGGPPVDTARYEAPLETRRGETRDPTSLMGFSDQPVKGRLEGSIAGWAPGTVFSLDNGQRWKVLKGSMTLRKPLDAPEILVVPGLAGRWFLQVREDLPKARVYRID